MICSPSWGDQPPRLMFGVPPMRSKRRGLLEHLYTQPRSGAHRRQDRAVRVLSSLEWRCAASTYLFLVLTTRHTCVSEKVSQEKMEAGMNAPVTTPARLMFLGLDDDGSPSFICYLFPAWFSP